MNMMLGKTPDRLLSGRFSKEEARIRRDLAACYRLVALYGWEDMLATHISARLPQEDGKECFLINPLGLLFDEMTASSLIKVNMDGEILQETPYKVNRAGFVIHSGVLAARPDVACAIHLHSLDGVAVSATEEGLLPLNQTAMTVASHVAFHEFEGVANNEEERERLGAVGQAGGADADRACGQLRTGLRGGVVAGLWLQRDLAGRSAEGDLRDPARI